MTAKILLGVLAIVIGLIGYEVGHIRGASELRANTVVFAFDPENSRINGFVYFGECDRSMWNRTKTWACAIDLRSYPEYAAQWLKKPETSTYRRH